MRLVVRQPASAESAYSTALAPRSSPRRTGGSSVSNTNGWLRVCFWHAPSNSLMVVVLCPPLPYIAHTRGWSAEDTENNIAFVETSSDLQEGAGLGPEERRDCTAGSWSQAIQGENCPSGKKGTADPLQELVCLRTVPGSHRKIFSAML